MLIAKASTSYGPGLPRRKRRSGGARRWAVAAALESRLRKAANWIGRSAWPQDGYFQGQLAEVRVWKVARTEAELQRDLSRKPSGSEPGLVAYLPHG